MPVELDMLTSPYGSAHVGGHRVVSLDKLFAKIRGSTRVHPRSCVAWLEVGGGQPRQEMLKMNIPDQTSPVWMTRSERDELIASIVSRVQKGEELYFTDKDGFHIISSPNEGQHGWKYFPCAHLKRHGRRAEYAFVGGKWQPYFTWRGGWEN